MKRLALSIGILGAVHASLWAWAPWIARLQTKNALERFQAIESLEMVIQAFQESMYATYIESGVLGLLFLLAAGLLLMHRRAGWTVWVGTLAYAVLSVAVTIVFAGFSMGVLLRLSLLGALAFSSHRVRGTAAWAAWFRKTA